MHMLRPDSQPLTRFEAGQHIQFQSRSDLNWLAVLTARVGVQARATCSHGDRYDAALETLTLGYSENWRVTTRRREAICFQLSVDSNSS